MGIWESALILLGVGIVSSRFKAGVGLQELGLGIRELGAAPLGGIGTGLGEFAGGLRLFAESLGDIGRGFGELFKHIPTLPSVPGLPLPGPADPYKGLPPPPTYMTVSGGDMTTQLTGGGGNVPRGPDILDIPVPTAPPGPAPTSLRPNGVSNFIGRPSAGGGGERGNILLV